MNTVKVIKIKLKATLENFRIVVQKLDSQDRSSDNYKIIEVKTTYFMNYFIHGFLDYKEKNIFSKVDKATYS